MVRLTEVYNTNWYIDTRDARLTMYKALNWIPPHLIGVPKRLKLPETWEYEGVKYRLKDDDLLQRHYEVADGNTK